MSIVKPTSKTRFHIDFDWWKQHDNDWRVHLLGCLCVEHQQMFQGRTSAAFVDWVDPQTAEVQRVDGLQHVLITHCARQSGFIDPHTTLVDAAFRTFLANGNIGLTSLELADRLHRQADTILRTFSSATVYKGIRPCPD
jgi:hypothetical protein